MRRTVLTSILGLMLLAGCEASEPAGNAGIAVAPSPNVTGAVIQLPAVPGRPGAAYFTISAGHSPTRLLSISSDRVERIELHETRMEGNVMRMGPLADASIQPGTPLTFEQGGRHAMLFGIDPALKAGDKATLTFTLENGEKIDTQAEVRAFGGSHEGH